MKNLKPIIGFTFTLCFSAGSFALEYNDDITIKEQTVTVASRNAITIRELSTSVSVLNSDDLEQLGYLGMSDMLASLPSISVSNNGGAGKTTSISVRGEAGLRTLVLLDGINIADPSAPQALAQMEHQTNTGIDRVEVLRGPHGMSYGADAGGVILLSSTREQANGFGAAIHTEFGQYGTSSLGGDIRFTNDTLAFSTAISQFETDGFNSSTADQISPDDDGYENITSHSKLALNISNSIRLSAVYRDTQGETEYDECFTFVHDCMSDYDQKSHRLALDINANGQHQIAYNQTDIERNNFSENIFSFGAKGSTSKLEYKGISELQTGHTLIYGADRKSEELTDLGIERDQLGTYLEYQASWNNRLFTNIGVRHDDNDDFGKHNSFRFGAARLYSLNNDSELKLKASYGTGFRAPSIYEEYLNAAFGPADMPELHEERAAGFDFGLEYFGKDDLRIELIYFQQKVEDEIFYDLVGFTGYLQGEGDSETSGVELIAEIPLNQNWYYYTNYTYTDSRESDGSLRSRQPRHSGKLGFRGSFIDNRLRFAMHMRANADIYDAVSSSRQDNYRVVDANLRYAILENLTLHLRLENILNDEYESVPGYYAAEASAYAGLKFQF